MSSPDPAKVSLGQTIEEALGKLTHQCRKYPTLKLLPAVCAKRKATKQKISGGKSYPIFSFCADCPGPVRIGTVTEHVPPAPAVSPARRKKKLTPTTCNRCGRGPEETKFYPSHVYTCIECKHARDDEHKPSKTYEEDPEAVKPIEDPPPAVAVPEQDLPAAAEIPAEPTAAALPYVCEIHGPHAGRMFGRSQSKLCPTCYAERISSTMKRAKSNGDPSPNRQITLPDWISAWAEEFSLEKGVPAREFVIGILGEQIPNEWLKAWLIKRS